jgi:hypothetical protein
MLQLADIEKKNKMNKQQKLDKIEEIEKELAELKAGVEEDDKKSCDFSQFIGRCDDFLCIKGNLMLKSVDTAELDLRYNNAGRILYNDTISYDIIKVKDLKLGDVFIMDEVEESGAELDDFGIFIGRDKDDDYVYQNLNNNFKLEKITDGMIDSCEEYELVKRFKRCD